MKRAFLALAGVTAVALATAAAAGAEPAGFHTSQPALLTPVKAGVTVEPIISVGDTLKNGYMFEAIPDGIAVVGHGKGRADVYVNHETSTVPFPFTPATGVGFNDFTNAMLSNLKINEQTHGVLDGSVRDPVGGELPALLLELPRQRRARLRARPHLHERGGDRRRQPRRHRLAGDAGERLPARAGRRRRRLRREERRLQVDLRHGPAQPREQRRASRATAIRSCSRATTRSPRRARSSTSTRPASAAAVWNDTGTLWAFKSDVPTINDYGDLTVGGAISGRFIEVPRAIAVGDQTGLENWSNANDVFQFIRVEDIAYDRTTPNVVYIADTGEPRAVPGPATARMTRGPATFRGPYMNGRLFKLVLNPSDPTRCDALDRARRGRGRLQQRQRDPPARQPGDDGAQRAHPGGSGRPQPGHLVRADLAVRHRHRRDRGDRAGQPGPGADRRRPGAWESSGIVDVSDVFGKDMFLADVQAGSLIVDEEVRGTLTYQREGGQLLLVKIPGA